MRPFADISSIKPGKSWHIAYLVPPQETASASRPNHNGANVDNTLHTGAIKPDTGQAPERLPG